MLQRDEGQHARAGGTNRARGGRPRIACPHRDVWLWDSVFHSLAMNYVDPDLAWDFIAAVLDSQRADGMIPICHSAHWPPEPMSQPPLLAWAVFENCRVAHRPDRLEWALPRLEHAIEWVQHERDQNGNGLFEWYIEDDPDCRAGESGMDNSPRFDAAIALDAVDFSTYAALDMAYLAAIASELGDTNGLGDGPMPATVRARAIHELLWDDERGFYCDRTMTGKRSTSPRSAACSRCCSTISHPSAPTASWSRSRTLRGSARERPYRVSRSRTAHGRQTCGAAPRGST